MVDELTIRNAINLLLRAAPRDSRVILFGSYARGQARPDSDLDFLVIEPQPQSELDESVRLRKALLGLPVAVDILVASEDTFLYWADTPNTVYYRAAKEGKVYEQVA
jgi:predicted nucleotidyltransferase